jgi:hypothetical protein
VVPVPPGEGGEGDGGEGGGEGDGEGDGEGGVGPGGGEVRVNWIRPIVNATMIKMMKNRVDIIAIMYFVFILID